jgi:phosphoglycolate phosphatase-like HAD superfamily hydrolase
MKRMRFLRYGRTSLILCLVLATGLFTGWTTGKDDPDPLPSWNAGTAKYAIIEFVHKTTVKGSPGYVQPEERVATFDQDGTLWVEHPLYSQLMFCFDRVPDLVAAKPELKEVEPFKTVMSGDREAISKLSMEDIEKIAGYTLSGMSEDQFTTQVRNWLAKAKDPRWKKPFTDLIYQPMLELMRYLRANGYKTYIVTGGGQDFVRVYSQQTYGVPPEQVVGSVGETAYVYDSTAGTSSMMKLPKMLLNDDKSGKPQGIQMVIGRRPYAAFGNTAGDQQMLEYTTTGAGMRLGMLLLHDDATREYAYGPAQGLPDSKIGTFSQDLYDLAKKRGWTVISMKNDWKTVFK